MPYFAKCLAASWNARKLDSERHGDQFHKAIKEIQSRNAWTAGQFYEYQCDQLQKMINHAIANVPYYKKIFSEAGITHDQIKRPEDLAKLPILEKSVVRSDPDSLIDENADRSKLVEVHTSGTTGNPLELWRDVWMNSVDVAYNAARWHSIVGLQRCVNRSVSIGGHLVASPDRSKPPFWVENARWKQLYMSSYHLAPDFMKYYIQKLRKFKADYIEGYPSSVYALARYIIDEKFDPIPFKAAFTTAETLFDYQRQAISQAFGCRTYNQYGCAEQVIFATECQAGSMHLSPEVGIVEVVGDDDNPVEPGQAGQLICTSLINCTQPFIRYRLGDVASLLPGNCSCGSYLPMLGNIEGRTDDVLLTRDGRLIGRLDPVFKGARGISEAQIIQDDYDVFRIRIVPSDAYSESDGKKIIKNLSQRIGRANIKIELVNQIERTKAGKFRAVIRNIPDNRD